MAQENGGEANIVKLDDFEGEVEEHWQDARGSKVLDSNGDEVGTVEELYVWRDTSTVHLIKLAGEERHVLIPVHAVTDVSEEGVEVEQDKDRILGSPEFDSDDVPDSEARRAAYNYYSYHDPLDMGGG